MTDKVSTGVVKILALIALALAGWLWTTAYIEETKSEPERPYMRYIEFDGHQYVKLRGGIAHSPKCWCSPIGR